MREVEASWPTEVDVDAELLTLLDELVRERVGLYMGMKGGQARGMGGR